MRFPSLVEAAQQKRNEEMLAKVASEEAARRKKLTLRPPPDGWKETIRRLHAEGYGDYRIGMVLGKPQSWVHRKRTDLGLKANYSSIRRGVR